MFRISFFILLFSVLLHSTAALADEKAEKIAQLKSEIARLDSELRTMQNDVPRDLKEQSFLRCYITCVKMAPVTCRCQMSYHRKKVIPGGTYFLSCPDSGSKKCNYPGYEVRANPKYRQGGCVHFDKSGYSFVTYVCNQHRYRWNFDLVQKYQALNKRYYRFDHVYTRYQTVYKELEKKREELNILEPPVILPEEDEEEETEEPDTITLHLGVKNFVLIDLKNNKFVVTKGAKNVGSDPDLSQKAPSLYFKRAACHVTVGEGKRKVWNLTAPWNIDFEVKKIDNVEVLQPGKKSVTVYKLDKKNQTAALKDSGNKVIYTSSQIGIYSSGLDVKEYKIKISFL